MSVNLYQYCQDVHSRTVTLLASVTGTWKINQNQEGIDICQFGANTGKKGLRILFSTLKMVFKRIR